MSLKFDTQNTWYQNSLPPKNTRNTSILIYSISQTLRPKNYARNLLTPQNTKGVNFQSPPQKKNTSDPPVMYTTGTPPPCAVVGMLVKEI